MVKEIGQEALEIDRKTVERTAVESMRALARKNSSARLAMNHIVTELLIKTSLEIFIDQAEQLDEGFEKQNTKGMISGLLKKEAIQREKIDEYDGGNDLYNAARDQILGTVQLLIVASDEDSSTQGYYSAVSVLRRVLNSSK